MSWLVKYNFMLTKPFIGTRVLEIVNMYRYVRMEIEIQIFTTHLYEEESDSINFLIRLFPHA